MDRLPTPVFWGFPCGSAGKESSHNAEDLVQSLGREDSPGEGKGYPFQYSGLENFMDCIVQVVTNSRTRLRDLHFHFPIYLIWQLPVLYTNVCVLCAEWLELGSLMSPALAGRFFTTSATWEATPEWKCQSIQPPWRTIWQ